MTIQKNILILIFLWILPVLSEKNYLSTVLPIIKEGLKSNTEELIKQKQIINLSEKSLNVLVAKGEITESQSQEEQDALNKILQDNYNKASYWQQHIYQIKRPFQFVYSKLADQNASYLERFAYGSAVAAGVAITIFGLYGGYTQSQKMHEIDKQHEEAIKNINEEFEQANKLTEELRAESAEKIKKIRDLADQRNKEFNEQAEDLKKRIEDFDALTRELEQDNEKIKNLENSMQAL